MKYNMPENSKVYPKIHIVEELENTRSDDINVDLNQERKHLQEQKEAEEFWAGRNLADRNSTRWAA
jgi:hypothetical protein